MDISNPLVPRVLLAFIFAHECSDGLGSSTSISTAKEAYRLPFSAESKCCKLCRSIGKQKQAYRRYVYLDRIQEISRLYAVVCEIWGGKTRTFCKNRWRSGRQCLFIWFGTPDEMLQSGFRLSRCYLRMSRTHVSDLN